MALTQEVGNSAHQPVREYDSVAGGYRPEIRIADLSAGEYETVAAGSTDQVLGATGAIGDYLAGLLIVPAVVACGAVSIKDGSGSSISIFVGGGTTALPSCIPFFVPLGLKATGAGWKVTTGASVSVIGCGNFT
jgi:hypothetical protein